MRLSDFKGEEAIEVFAEIVEPLSMIICDDDIQELARAKAMPVKYVKPALKNHKKEVIEIFATLNRKTVQEFENELNLLNLPVMIVDLINDPEVQNLFRSQGQIIMTSSANSGSAMENIEAEGN